jgi:rhamnosyltransferase subunit B
VESARDRTTRRKPRGLPCAMAPWYTFAAFVGCRHSGAGNWIGMRILIHVLGTSGDLFPHIGIAKGLQARGHSVCVASHAFHRARIEAAGVACAAVRPDLPQSGAEARILTSAMTGGAFGMGRLFDQYQVPRLPATYADLLPLARQSDLLISACNGLAGPFVAQSLGMKWVSSCASPFMLGSRLDYPILPQWPRATMWLKDHGKRGTWLNRLIRFRTRRWLRGIYPFGRGIGVPVTGHPMYEFLFSPYATLAMSIAQLVRPQPPDWPERTRLTGFIPWNAGDDKALPDDLQRFLDAGPAPIVFTLGSFVTRAGAAFYRTSAEACLRLGQRAVLLVGHDSACRAGLPQSPLLHVADYVPHAALFPRACMVFNHGGMGSVGQTLLARKPMVVVPFGMDQFDVAYRVRRCGLGELLMVGDFTVERVMATIRRVLNDRPMAEAATRAGDELARQDGVATACDVVEDVLAGPVLATTRR